jgi:hypothetical protein
VINGVRCADEQGRLFGDQLIRSGLHALSQLLDGQAVIPGIHYHPIGIGFRNNSRDKAMPVSRQRLPP